MGLTGDLSVISKTPTWLNTVNEGYRLVSTVDRLRRAIDDQEV